MEYIDYSIEYPPVIDKHNYSLFENNNPEVALNVLLVYLNVEIFKVGCG